MTAEKTIESDPWKDESCKIKKNRYNKFNEILIEYMKSFMSCFFLVWSIKHLIELSSNVFLSENIYSVWEVHWKFH